jgi:uncharacterized membrane protein YczE
MSAAPSLVRRWTQLLVAFALFGLAIALMMRSRLGLGPWDAFHQGLNELTGMTVGTASIAAGLVVLVASMAIGVRPGVGTVANMILIGLLTDAALPLVPDAPGTAWAVGYYAAALLIAGPATGMYIAAGLGSGPRDGLMLALSDRLRWPVRRVRLGLELVVLAAGWMMGATIGLGTALFALAIGPMVQWGLHLFGVLPAGRDTADVEAAAPLDEAA